MRTTKTIFVDVDGTLRKGKLINQKVVAWCILKWNEGYELVLWSARGREYAEKAAREAGIRHLFEACVSKPTHILDDKGWSWIRFVKVARLSMPRIGGDTNKKK